MKKIILILFVCLLTSCSEFRDKKPHELLLSIKNYSCEMQITCFSNKNTTCYTAVQGYQSTGIYTMEFLDSENLKINYENSSLILSAFPIDVSIIFHDYPEINSNPLFLSYFINTYFNTEDINKINHTDTKISLTLPEINEYLSFAELSFKNNLPYSLSYFDKNGKVKVNIIYNEFNSY